MYVRHSLNELDLLVCRKCGTPQESPGSTICEQCGADLLRLRVAKTASRHPLLQLQQLLHPVLGLRHLLAVPGRLLHQAPTALAVLSFIIFRTVTQLLLLAALSLGLCFVPEVNVRVPATKEIAATAAAWVEYAAMDWRSTLLGSRVADTHPAQRPAPSAARQPKPVQFVATQAVLIDSTPGGAIVRLGTRTVGKTPMTLRVAPGTYTVTIIRAGYAPVTRTITVRQGHAASVGVKLVAATVVKSPPDQSTLEPRRSQDQIDQRNQNDEP